MASPCVHAGEPTDKDHLDKISKSDEVDAAVEKGLAWLVTQQDVTTGSFAGGLPVTYTGLSCMALMAAGHFPGRSKYGENLRKGVLFLAKVAKENKGYLGRDGRMYGHGICALALSEAYGMLQDEKENKEVKEATELAVKLILHAQAKQGGQKGGWRYEPNPGDADLSVTAWQILALRSAQNCKLAVPDQAVTDALDYLRRVYHAGSRGFSYQGGGASPAMRAAGVVAMLALGANKADDDKSKIEISAEFLLTCDPTTGGHFFYQSYYFATAANMMGEKHRDILLPKLEKFLVSLQQPNGEFRKHTGYDGGVYSTAFSIICLCVRYQYLPIYQE